MSRRHDVGPPLRRGVWACSVDRDRVLLRRNQNFAPRGGPTHWLISTQVSCLLTPAHGTNALIYESNPGREDWTAFEGSEGAALAFPGGLAAHFTSENTTGVTRWSIDARVVADSSTSAYDAGSYFAVAERVGGAWRRVGDGVDAVDPRVGIPFDRT